MVDYDSTANKLHPAARWDAETRTFLSPRGTKVHAGNKNTPQFRQVSTWAIVQSTLEYFESAAGLGRRIMWGFEGNRLIVVPAAGYDENAYYDRRSKSLQFYYFDNDKGERVYTCLSSDIVNHEFGHALLDGIRPYFLEAVTPQTGAFHEFLGDLTAILMTLRNGSFRKVLAERTQGDLKNKVESALLSAVAAEFGNATEGQPYLRSADNEFKLGDFLDETRPHKLSQVMTGAMFDIIVSLTAQYMKREGVTAAKAYAYTFHRMQVIAVQSLDLLPPVEVTFKDYALAILRNLEVADPKDENKYREMISKVFVRRQILTNGDWNEAGRPYALERVPGEVPHDPTVIATSRAEAYRFLDDNRDDLLIPDNVDIVVAEVFTAEKVGGLGLRQPKQIIIQYLWREDLQLEGKRFGTFAGRTTSLLCGATLVIDENGSLLHHARKAGSLPSEAALAGQLRLDEGKEPFKKQIRALSEVEDGKKRRDAYLEALARRIEEGMVGEELGGAMGLASGSVPPLTSRTVDGLLRFELTPHFGIDEVGDDSLRGLQWQTSS